MVTCGACLEQTWLVSYVKNFKSYEKCRSSLNVWLETMFLIILWRATKCPSTMPVISEDRISFAQKPDLISPSPCRLTDVLNRRRHSCVKWNFKWSTEKLFKYIQRSLNFNVGFLKLLHLAANYVHGADTFFRSYSCSSSQNIPCL
jgi:hypothetical protein